MDGEGTPMMPIISMKRMRVTVAGLMLLAAGATFGAPQAKAPGDPEMIDARGFQKILEQHRGKPLLVNFWATWC